MELGPDAVFPQLCGQGNGGGEVFRHGQDQHVRGGGGEVRVQKPLLPQNIEEPGQADGNPYAGELFFCIIFR